MTEEKKDTRRQEPIFWLKNNCPICGYPSQSPLYIPDVLDGPIRNLCCSTADPNEETFQCDYQWEFHVDDEGRKSIEVALKLAFHSDMLTAQLQKIAKFLGETCTAKKRVLDTHTET